MIRLSIAVTYNSVLYRDHLDCILRLLIRGKSARKPYRYLITCLLTFYTLQHYKSFFLLLIVFERNILIIFFPVV